MKPAKPTRARAARPHRTPGSAPILGLLLGIVGVIIFSGTLPATRIAVESFSPSFLTFGRAALAAIASILLIIGTGRQLMSGKTVLLFAIGCLLIYGFPGFMALAMQTLPASHGAVVLGILPLATAVFAIALTQEKVSALFWVCSVIGASVVIAFALRGGNRSFEIGDLWLTLGGLSAALGYVLSGKLANEMPGWEIICRALILTTPITALGCVIFWNDSALSAPWPHIWSLIYLGLGSMFLGFFAWNAGLHLGGIAKVGQLQLFQIFFTIAISAAVLEETISWDMMGYAIAVFLVVIIGQSTRRKKT